MKLGEDSTGQWRVGVWEEVTEIDKIQAQD